MSSPPYLLDTNVIVALVRGNTLARTIDETFGLRASKIRHMASVVSQGEVRVLAERNKWGTAKRSALDNALDNLVTVDISHPAIIAAYVEIDLYSHGHEEGARNMGKNDLWIAACAKATNSTLLTTDRDFDHLDPSLVRVSYIDPASASTR